MQRNMISGEKIQCEKILCKQDASYKPPSQYRSGEDFFFAQKKEVKSHQMSLCFAKKNSLVAMETITSHLSVPERRNFAGKTILQAQTPTCLFAHYSPEDLRLFAESQEISLRKEVFFKGKSTGVKRNLPKR
ncbi:hypothetical protein TNCT_524181 [Trichonephila clavata]|uniref:Uncharacterized protein n=1 Tax=Trichonephila clavata TaxID=2740835 RepID=A0A8X6FHT9_TRICU|nr:hypothetical protein TNCT_524181 [Trichonephila clavata]